MQSVRYPPPLTAEEEELRVQAVDSLNMLDTKEEERFDRLCRIACELLEAPVAYVSFIHRERQWFKSICGISGISETPKQGTFCEVAIRTPSLMIVPDALEDEYFKSSPFVIGEPHVRFYLGQPLLSEGNHRVGTFCVLDFKPRHQLNQGRLKLFQDLSRVVQTEISLKDALETQLQLLEHQKKLREQAAFVRRVLGRYVTDEVAEHILAAPEELHLGGERREVTILMSDLRGFTPMSERLEPEKVVTILNHYLHHMVEIVMKWGGTIDEIIGDALLIIFGAPLPLADHAQRAAACALEMQQAMPALNELLQAEGLPPIHCGVGLNTGEVVVGNIGSEKRMKYSVVGSPVNLTARIESLTIGGQILASESTVEALGEEVQVDGRLRVNMKGYDRPVTIFEIGGFRGVTSPHHRDHSPASHRF